MSSDVTVYTSPGCMACRATTRQMDRIGIAYQVVDISADEIGRQTCLGLGYTAVPVVVADGEHWSGHRPDRIAALAGGAGTAS